MVPPTPEPSTLTSPLITQLERGIKIASSQKNIEDWDNLKPKLRRVLIYLQQGHPLSKSLNNSQVSWQQIGQILELGDEKKSD